MTDMRETIIETIRRNRISTTEVADAMGKSGVMTGMTATVSDIHKVGVGRALFAAFESNHAIHDQMRDVLEGEIPIVFTHECGDRAVFGDLVSKFALLYRGAEALVIDGLMRDAPKLRRERYPVWCQGYTPLGCFNRPADPFPQDNAQVHRDQVDGGIVVCDDSGVVVIPPDAATSAETLQRMEGIELQEDIWFFCLDTLKWDTKRIVCEKAYLEDDMAVLPPILREKVAQMDLNFSPRS